MPAPNTFQSAGSPQGLYVGDYLLADRYQLLEVLREGDPARGSPSVWRVSDGASLAFAKVWSDNPDFPEVQAIWAYEVRNLLRLGGLPAADEVFVRLRELGQDPSGFVIILDGEGREPLSSVLEARDRHPWLAGIRSSRTRRTLWTGLHRVARGLAMMHAEGTLHRALGPESIFTDLEGQGDFRLSGFEWSLRISPASTWDEAAPRRSVPAPELAQRAAQYSVASDWFSFGALCAQLVAGATDFSGEDRSGGLKRAFNAAGLTPLERRLIDDLVDSDPERRMWHATDVTNAIEEIAQALAGDRLDGNKPLYVGFDLSRGSALSKKIDQLLEGTGSDMRDPVAKLGFVKDDLGSEPQVSARKRPFPHYVLHGRQIDYLLTRWGASSTPSWEIASCVKPDAYQTTPAAKTYRSHRQRIEPRLEAFVAENVRSIRREAERWDLALPIENDDRALTAEQSGIIRFLQVTNQLEALLILASMWPVTVVGKGESGHRSYVDVTPTEDAERDELARLVNVPPPAEQMRRLFQADQVVERHSAEQAFAFGGEGRLLRRDQSLNEPWAFGLYFKHQDGPRYRFFQTDPKGPLPSGLLFLRPKDLTGSTALLLRRKKAIKDLGSHRIILDAIDDPRGTRRTTTGSPPDTQAVADLDLSKRKALDEIWRSQPLYMLQGPPGTGKTTLVATLAAEQIATSASAQILITAQSHTIVDNVADEVLEAFDGDADHLAIRLDAEREPVRRKDLGRRLVGTRLAHILARSAAAQIAPSHIRNRLATLELDRGHHGAMERIGFERLVENGASVVFATTNSGDLAQLLDAGRRYDWSIVEEAGRAHGFDLALPMQASHRVLMIGDHQQLPPFNLATMRRLLSDPHGLLQALKYGSRFAPSIIERHSWSELSADFEGFEDDCARWAGSLHLFKAMFQRCEAAGLDNGDAIARQLKHQHRMHPDLRGLVAACFYPDLMDADSATERFATVPDPFRVLDGGWLPTERIVFLDVPYVQQGRHARGEDTKPRYTSPVEVEAVLRVLEQLQPPGEDAADGDIPTIQVLSPYRAQVNAIRRAVRRKQAEDELLSLDGFKIQGNSNGDIGATVDEFQGNQADVVVVSLVRNNHAKVGRGVGFLEEGSRWNVMLSRAKRKLVLVGSWDFLWKRFPEGCELPAEDPMSDLATVMRAICNAEKAGRVRRVRLGTLPVAPWRVAAGRRGQRRGG